MSQNVIEDAGLSIDQASLSELLSASQADNSIFIKIICNDEEKMDAIAESVKTQLKEKESKLQIVGSHKLRLLGESQNAVVDNALVDRKGAISNTISILNTQLGTLKSGMNEQQLNLLDNEEENRKDFAKTQVPQFNIKYAILGLGFGIFVICAWIAYKIGFATRLQSSEEIRSQYGVRLAGVIELPFKKKRFFSSLDSAILSIKNRKRKQLTIEHQIGIVSANIALTCRKNGIDCVYMTGSEYENMDTSILELLKAELAARNVQVKEGGNIFYDVESLERGTELGNMLFIEQVNVSIYDEIANEFNLAKEQGSHILGVVVFT